MSEFTDAQTGWLDAQLSTIAILDSIADVCYDVLAWAESALDAWEAQAIRRRTLPPWYVDQADAAADYLYNALLRLGAAEAEAAARQRLVSEPALRCYTSILLDGQRELLWLEHLRWLCCADSAQIEDLTNTSSPPYISRCEREGP